MAFDSNNLSALSYANGFTLWHYKTPDDIFDVHESGYFDGAAGLLREGDFIFTNAGWQTEFAANEQLAVLLNRNGVVEVG